MNPINKYKHCIYCDKPTMGLHFCGERRADKSRATLNFADQNDRDVQDLISKEIQKNLVKDQQQQQQERHRDADNDDDDDYDYDDFVVDDDNDFDDDADNSANDNNNNNDVAATAAESGSGSETQSCEQYIISNNMNTQGSTPCNRIKIIVITKQRSHEIWLPKTATGADLHTRVRQILSIQPYDDYQIVQLIHRAIPDSEATLWSMNFRHRPNYVHKFSTRLLQGDTLKLRPFGRGENANSGYEGPI